MNNPFDELRVAIEQGRNLKRAAESQANALADLLEGNLRAVSHSRLQRLKKELRDFNMQTGRWKS